MLPVETIAFLVTGAALAGFVMGLAGFGTGLAALGFWLLVVDPLIAVPLVSICSIATTAFTLHAYVHAISWARLAPFFAGAVAGLPLGILLLGQLDPALFKVVMGIFLVGYTLIRLIIVPALTARGAGRFMDAIVGLGGGILGGFAAIPGATDDGLVRSSRAGPRTSSAQCISRSTRSSFFWHSPGYASQGMLTQEVGLLAFYCVPASLLGMAIGMAGYKRIGEMQFQKLILWLLLASGDYADCPQHLF